MTGRSGRVIDRVLDGLLPTRRQPAPVLGTADAREVVIDRTGAAVIDVVVCYVLLEFPLVYVFSVLAPGTYSALGGYVIPLSLVVLLPIYATYSFACEWRYGRTPGKVNRGLVVVMADGRECTLRASAVRNLLRYVDVLGVPPLLVGSLAMLVADGRRVGDLLADTCVVRATAPPDREDVVTAEMDTSAAARSDPDSEKR